MDLIDQLSAEEARVVGALIEKAATTPDNYPLSTNGLTAACNQSTSRDPVVDYRDRDIDIVMLQLRERGLARTLTGAGHRVPKHRHVVDEALGLSGSELAVLAVLLLRGPQTQNELVSRTERYAGGPEGDTDLVTQAIDSLAARAEPLALRLDRRPGEREPRIRELWSTPTVDDPADPVPASHHAPPLAQGEKVVPLTEPANLESRVAALEAELATQTERLDQLLRELEG